MDFSIDISIMTPTEAVGRISGIISLEAVPPIGSSIPFSFGSHLQVVHVLFYPLQQGKPPNSLPSISLMLSDLVMPSVAEAEKAAHSLSTDFGLLFEKYNLPKP